MPTQIGDNAFLGMNSRTDPELLQPGEVALAKNMRFRNGKAGTRKGLVKVAFANNILPADTGDAINPWTNIRGVGVFKDPDRRQFLLLAADDKLYYTLEGNNPILLQKPAGVDLKYDCNFVQAFNKVLLLRGRTLAPLVMDTIDAGFLDLAQHWNDYTTYADSEELAYGPVQAVTSITRSGTTATVTTTADHGFITNQDITTFGAADITRTITTLTASSTTATAITSGAHGYFTGERVNVAGATPTTFNGEYTITEGQTATEFTYTMATTPSPTTASGTLTHAGQLYNGRHTITVTDDDTFTFTLPYDPGANATGTLTCSPMTNYWEVTTSTSVTESPDTDPGNFTQIDTIMPFADDGIFVQNRALVYSQYEVDIDGNNTRVPANASYARKADYIYASDILDIKHTYFDNQFRINQGSSDEIVSLAKVSENQVVVFKNDTVFLLSSFIQGNNTELGATVQLTSLIPNYGLIAPRAFAVVGEDVYFMSGKRGVVSIKRNLEGRLHGVDLPISDEIDSIVQSIDWVYASEIRMAYYDNKLFVAVPLSEDTGVQGDELHTNQGVAFSSPIISWSIKAVPGRQYWYDKASNGVSLTSGSTTLTSSGSFIAAALPDITTMVSVTDSLSDESVKEYVTDTNTAILVYDFLNKKWAGYDTGNEMRVKEFFKMNYAGVERLFFSATDGYINLVEDGFGTDDSFNTTTYKGLVSSTINTTLKTRGYSIPNSKHEVMTDATIDIATHNPKYSVAMKLDGVEETSTIVTDRTKSQTAYYRPFDKAAWTNTNTNNDHATPYREDYRVLAATAGFYLGAAGIDFNRKQQTQESFTLPSREGRFAQLELTNTQGHIDLNKIVIDVMEGQESNTVKS